MRASVSITAATFSDGTSVHFEPNDIVVFVGPNNSGKSRAVADLRSLTENSRANRLVVTSISTHKSGSEKELFEWLEATSFVYKHSDIVFSFGIRSISQEQAKYRWRAPEGLGELSAAFARHIRTSDRLESVKPPENISLTSTAPQHPIHFLQRDDGIERRVSGYFRQAFGMDLIVHHNAGNKVPLYCGDRPATMPGEDRVSARYLRALEELPQLDAQGDGMRSFAGVILHAVIGFHSMVMLDEPEAFLHPPQARLLGKMLATEVPELRQLFISTHSTEIVQGLLDANKGNVRVIRLTRNGNVNHVRELKTQEVQQLWADPLLRHSNVLSGLFHERVVVCEADADCRFYAAILDSLFDEAVVPRRDVMFVHCGGKYRIPMVVKALRSIGVPAFAISDFDVLNDEQTLQGIYEALGGDWSQAVGDWKIVKAAVEQKKPELGSEDVRNQIQQLLGAVTTPSFPESVGDQIRDVVRRSSPWSTAKAIGKSFVPSGGPFEACSRLLGTLARHGLHVVEVGELEGFARSIAGHGPRWVNAVLPKLAARDPELNPAREFVAKLVA